MLRLYDFARYPVAYTVLILPIAACRYASFAGHKVPFAATIFSGAVFMLSGLVNTILFASTRRVVPKRDALLSISITRIQQQSSSSSVLIHKEDVEAYTAPTTLHDINEKALPPIPNGSEESFSSADAHSLPLDFSSLDLAAMRPTSVDTGSVPFGHLRELPATHQVARRSESFHSIASRGSDGSQAPLTRPGRMDVGAGGGRSWNGPTPLWRRSTLGTSDLL